MQRFDESQRTTFPCIRDALPHRCAMSLWDTAAIDPGSETLLEYSDVFSAPFHDYGECCVEPFVMNVPDCAQRSHSRP